MMGKAKRQEISEGSKQILEVNGLKTYFFTSKGVVRAVDDVSFQIGYGETVGIVGESGCGKSVTSLSIMGLVPGPGKIVGGQILLEGRDLTLLNAGEMRKVRGGGISMIFQEPMTSLNPVFTVGDQVAEAVMLHQAETVERAHDITVELLSKVGISSPRERADAYPHQLSGGMKQRVMIAMALACGPRLLIADEPTTALDVTIQAQILAILNDIVSQYGMSIMLITHDLGVVAQTCQRVVVMYAGKVVEHALVATLYEQPLHPYTRGLFRSLPNLEKPHDRLEPIEGRVPGPFELPTGCRFRTRCPYATDLCLQLPALQSHGDGHLVACHHAGEISKGEKSKTGPLHTGGIVETQPEVVMGSMRWRRANARSSGQR